MFYHPRRLIFYKEDDLRFIHQEAHTIIEDVSGNLKNGSPEKTYNTLDPESCYALACMHFQPSEKENYL